MILFSQANFCSLMVCERKNVFIFKAKRCCFLFWCNNLLETPALSLLPHRFLGDLQRDAGRLLPSVFESSNKVS